MLLQLLVWFLSAQCSDKVQDGAGGGLVEVLAYWLISVRSMRAKMSIFIYLLRNPVCTLRELVAEAARSEAGVVLTTYEGLRAGREHLLNVRWGYAVLDEGHKIRNPDTEVTLVAKQLPTLHRCGRLHLEELLCQVAECQ